MQNKKNKKKNKTNAREAHRPALSSHNTKQDWKNMTTKSKAKLNMKRPVVKTT